MIIIIRAMVKINEYTMGEFGLDIYKNVSGYQIVVVY